MERENHGNSTWIGGYTASKDPTTGTGILNVRYGTSQQIYIYDGTPVPPGPGPTPASKKRDRFPWVLYARKFRENRQSKNFMI